MLEQIDDYDARMSLKRQMTASPIGPHTTPTQSSSLIACRMVNVKGVTLPRCASAGSLTELRM